MDGKANDGEAGEGDNVANDVEAVYGGQGNDTLTGGSRADTIDGEGGNDTITGGGSADFLYGGPGNDTINARDGKADTIDCGPGSDRVIADKSDSVTNCELKGAAFSRRVSADVGNFWVVKREPSGKTFTQPTRLEVIDISPADAKVTVNCSGSGCPFKSKTFTPKRKKVGLLSSFGRRKLRPGTKIVILVTANDALGRYISYTMRPTSTPKRVRACVLPGDSAPSSCPS
jgi:Ca2+-binding RTX toxin-like protein